MGLHKKMVDNSILMIGHLCYVNWVFLDVFLLICVQNDLLRNHISFYCLVNTCSRLSTKSPKVSFLFVHMLMFVKIEANQKGQKW